MCGGAKLSGFEASSSSFLLAKRNVIMASFGLELEAFWKSFRC
ncbi:MAG: hypothetical protein ACKERG_01060 [Candidatus Hodgkinia cicadicola]